MRVSLAGVGFLIGNIARLTWFHFVLGGRCRTARKRRSKTLVFFEMP